MKLINESLIKILFFSIKLKRYESDPERENKKGTKVRVSLQKNSIASTGDEKGSEIIKCVKQLNEENEAV